MKEEEKKMKLELVEFIDGSVVFRDKELYKSRKLFTAKSRGYFIYKNLRIYVDEFVPQCDGSLIFIR